MNRRPIQSALPLASRPNKRERWSDGRMSIIEGDLVNEVPIAIVFNGSTAAVMMASPLDVSDFATGFALSEGFIRGLDDVETLEVICHDQGIEARFWVNEDCSEAIAERRRAMMGPIGCGLCGIDSLDQAIRDLPNASAQITLSAKEISQSVDSLRAYQPLHDSTHSSHAAGFLVPGQGLLVAREDVGRHNALDKLIGALSTQRNRPRDGAIVMTSRLSVELVQKCAIVGCSVLVGVSGPSNLAVETARRANLTLVGFCRRGGFDVFCHPQRIV